MDVYYVHLQKNKTLVLFANNTEEFDRLNRLLLSVQRLSNYSDNV